jgi:competence protein ComEC
MLAVAVVLLRSAGWRWPWALVLLAAAVVVTAVDPWALLQPGFWLSFTAVALLMASEPAAGAPVPGPGPRGLLAGHGLRTQAVATLGLAPLSLVFFQQVQRRGCAGQPGGDSVGHAGDHAAGAGRHAGARAVGSWAAWLVQALVWGLGWLAQLPLAVWQRAGRARLAGGCRSAGRGAWLVMPLPWRLRCWACR